MFVYLLYVCVYAHTHAQGGCAAEFDSPTSTVINYANTRTPMQHHLGRITLSTSPFCVYVCICVFLLYMLLYICIFVYVCIYCCICLYVILLLFQGDDSNNNCLYWECRGNAFVRPEGPKWALYLHGFFDPCARRGQRSRADKGPAWGLQAERKHFPGIPSICEYSVHNYIYIYYNCEYLFFSYFL